MITYKGTPITLSANFAIETLQARREWHDIFKVMKGKNLTTKNILPSKTLVQIWWRNQKLSKQAKVKRIQHHQASFTTNAKGTSSGRKHKRRKRTTMNKPQTIENGSRIKHMDNSLKCKWIKCTNQKTDWLGDWIHVLVCSPTYHITLLDSPNCIKLFYIAKILMFPFWLGFVIIFYFSSGYWL